MTIEAIREDQVQRDQDHATPNVGDNFLFYSQARLLSPAGARNRVHPLWGENRPGRSGATVHFEIEDLNIRGLWSDKHAYAAGTEEITLFLFDPARPGASVTIVLDVLGRELGRRTVALDENGAGILRIPADTPGRHRADYEGTSTYFDVLENVAATTPPRNRARAPAPNGPGPLILSRFGRELRAIRAPTGQGCRGFEVEEGKANACAVEVETLVNSQGTLVVREAIEDAFLTVLHPASGEIENRHLGTLASGASIQFSTEAPYSIAMMGWLRNGRRQEGTGVFLSPVQLDLAISCHPSEAAGQQLSIDVSVNPDAGDASVFLVVRSAKGTLAKQASIALSTGMASAITAWAEDVPRRSSLAYRELGTDPTPSSGSPQWPAPLLGEILLSRGHVNPRHLHEALHEDPASWKRIGQVLSDAGHVPEDLVYQALAEQQRLPYVDLSEHERDEDALGCIPDHIAARHRILPLSCEDGILTVATPEPLNILAFDEVALMSGFRIRVQVASASQVDARLDECYGRERLQEEILQRLEREPSTVESTESERTSGHEELFLPDEQFALHPAIPYVNCLIVAAHNQRGSVRSISILETGNSAQIEFSGIEGRHTFAETTASAAGQIRHRFRSMQAESGRVPIRVNNTPLELIIAEDTDGRMILLLPASPPEENTAEPKRVPDSEVLFAGLVQLSGRSNLEVPMAQASGPIQIEAVAMRGWDWQTASLETCLPEPAALAEGEALPFGRTQTRKRYLKALRPGEEPQPGPNQQYRTFTGRRDLLSWLGEDLGGSSAGDAISRTLPTYVRLTTSKVDLERSRAERDFLAACDQLRWRWFPGIGLGTGPTGALSGFASPRRFQWLADLPLVPRASTDVLVAIDFVKRLAADLAETPVDRASALENSTPKDIKTLVAQAIAPKEQASLIHGRVNVYEAVARALSEEPSMPLSAVLDAVTALEVRIRSFGSWASPLDEAARILMANQLGLACEGPENIAWATNAWQTDIRDQPQLLGVEETIEEDWTQLPSTCALRAELEAEVGDDPRSDHMVLVVESNEYNEGDQAYVFLGPHLARVQIDGDPRRFRVDFQGETRLEIPVMVPALRGNPDVSDNGFLVCLRNSYDPARMGIAGGVEE